jgi:hypothetical protein
MDMSQVVVKEAELEALAAQALAEFAAQEGLTLEAAAPAAPAARAMGKTAVPEGSKEG